MIVSNAKGIFMAIWLENILLDNGSIVWGLLGATEKERAETSKMLMYWGVDEPLQSDLP